MSKRCDVMKVLVLTTLCQICWNTAWIEHESIACRHTDDTWFCSSSVTPLQFYNVIYILQCQEDLSFPLGELVETTGMPTYYVDEDYPARPEIQQPLPEWSKWRGSESSTLETDVYVWCYALLAAHTRNCKKMITSGGFRRRQRWAYSINMWEQW